MLRLLGWNRAKHLITKQQQQQELPPGFQSGGSPGGVPGTGPHFQPQRQIGAVELTSGQHALAAAWPAAGAAAPGAQRSALDSAWGG